MERQLDVVLDVYIYINAEGIVIYINVCTYAYIYIICTYAFMYSRRKTTDKDIFVTQCKHFLSVAAPIYKSS